MYQREFVLSLMQTGGMSLPQSAADGFESVAEGTEYDNGTLSYSPVSGFEWIPRAIFNRGEISAADVYAVLSEVNDVLKSRIRSSKGEDKAHYTLLQSYINYGTSLK